MPDAAEICETTGYFYLLYKGYTAYTDRAEEVLDLVCDLMPPAERQEVSLHLITDGLDNSSAEEDRAEFNEKLETLEKKGWKIMKEKEI